MIPVVVQPLSVLPLDRHVGADGSTWLDRELVADAPVMTRDAGFGRDVRDALARRRQWLIGQDLARMEQDRIVYRVNLLALLRRRVDPLRRAAFGRSSHLSPTKAGAAFTVPHGPPQAQLPAL